LDFYENVKFHTVKSRKKTLEPRGALSNYLSINSEETLFDNTLTGFLISHYLRGGKQAESGYTFDELLSVLTDVYETLRRPNGSLYSLSTKNLKRSLLCALTANALFRQGKRAQKLPKRTLKKQPPVDVWLIKREEALHYREQEIRRIAETKGRLRVRTSKLGNGLSALSLSIRNVGMSNLGSPNIGDEEDAESSGQDTEERDELEEAHHKRMQECSRLDGFKVSCELFIL
jgi:hypothetical protein